MKAFCLLAAVLSATSVTARPFDKVQRDPVHTCMNVLKALNAKAFCASFLAQQVKTTTLSTTIVAQTPTATTPTTTVYVTTTTSSTSTARVYQRKRRGQAPGISIPPALAIFATQIIDEACELLFGLPAPGTSTILAPKTKTPATVYVHPTTTQTVTVTSIVAQTCTYTCPSAGNNDAPGFNGIGGGSTSLQNNGDGTGTCMYEEAYESPDYHTIYCVFDLSTGNVIGVQASDTDSHDNDYCMGFQSGGGLSQSCS